MAVMASMTMMAADGIKSHSASFAMPEELNAYTTVGEEAPITLTLVNHGTTAIRNIDYTIEVNGTTTERHQSVTLAAQYYGRKKSINTTIPAVYQRGTRPVTFCVTKINGEDNQDPQPSAVLQMAFLAETPKHKPLMEEYTGTWCGWCPRGMAAMEAMTELYGDDFVGVAFHNGDAMQITNNYPKEISGYPGSTLDRVGGSIDPFETGFRRIGVQTIYRGGGEEHRSNIGWHYFGGDAVHSIAADDPSGEMQHFDLSGRRVSDSHRSLTITRLPDGRAVKQLR